ncbi:serine hydrolase [Marinihelvus fidelis]|nr:serine hydrolase [Marinihelvus fidelis]
MNRTAMTHRILLPGLLLMLAGCATAQAPATVPAAESAPAAPATANIDIDLLARYAMETFDVPGMAVGVIKDGEVVYAAGHGLREAGQPGGVNTDTLFRLASVTKAFTAAAAAVMVDDGKLSWDGPVNQVLPALRMNDPWVTANISMVDLLAHRSGLPAHAGDLLLWPVPNAFTEDDIVAALQYFPLDAGFRNGYTYDNVLYIVAAQAIEQAGGTSWGETVDTRLMAPLGLDRCFAGVIPEEQMRNLAAPHGGRGSDWSVIERNRIPRQPDKFSPAGGIACSLDDMLTWVGTQLAGGVGPDGTAVFSPAAARTMWRPHNPLGVSGAEKQLHGTNFKAYGLGWRLRDVHGVMEVSHTGSLDGWRAHVVMAPDLGLGIVTLLNSSSSAARSAVSTQILYSYLDAPPIDWVGWYRDQQSSGGGSAEQDAEPDRGPVQPARPLARYTGQYADPWFGDVAITLDEGTLRFSADKAPKFTGPLLHHDGDLFLAQWDDREVGMDAWVRFVFDPAGRVTGVRMNRQMNSPSDLDHFRFLDLVPVDNAKEANR